MSDTLKDKIQDMERAAILSALEECDWVRARAARKLGITERMICYRIKKYGIESREVVKDSRRQSAFSKDSDICL